MYSPDAYVANLNKLLKITINKPTSIQHRCGFVQLNATITLIIDDGVVYFLHSDEPLVLAPLT